MNHETFEKIEQQLKFLARTPLTLSAKTSGVCKESCETIRSQKTLPQMVYKLLELCRTMNSIDSFFDSLETGASRRRSSLDIWRHLIYLIPEISLQEVMEALYQLEEDGYIVTNYCSTIKRRVFYISNTATSREFEFTDEYGLTFNDWGQ